MLPISSKKQQTYSPDFFDRVTSLFLGFETGHMGADMYCDHKGVRTYQDGNGQLHMESMSGVTTWDEHAKHGTVPRLSRQFFVSNINRINDYIRDGLPVVEYGPGSMDDAAILVKVTKSKLYIPVDNSEGILQQASGLKNCEVRPEKMDVFSNRNLPLIDEPALAAFLGLTITNLSGAVPKTAPKEALINTFQNLSRPIGSAGGYLLIATHAERNGERNKALYNEEWHKKFGVNFLYRIKEELPTCGFNPDLFEYHPVWHEECGLLAHTVRATHDQEFRMGEFNEIKVSVKAGDIFHYNNSFKFAPDFFEDCARAAGARIIDKWEDGNGMMLYLFAVTPMHNFRPVPKAAQHQVGQAL